MSRALLFAAALSFSAPLMAQIPGPNAVKTLTDSSAIADAASSAAQNLRAKAKSHLLAKQILGREITGPGGEILGTIQNLVIVPGGTVLAVIIDPKNGRPMALPYRALKVSAAASTASKLGLSLPISLEEARGMSAIQDLTTAVLGQGN